MFVGMCGESMGNTIHHLQQVFCVSCYLHVSQATQCGVRINNSMWSALFIGKEKKREKIHLERIGDVWVTVVGGVGVVCVCHF